MPLGVKLCQHSEKLKTPPTIETQEHPVESKETLSKIYFAGSYLTAIRRKSDQVQTVKIA